MRVKLIIILIVSLVVVSFALIQVSPPSGDTFTGLCVYSSPDFSVLYNGNQSVAVGKPLKVGVTYTLHGRLRKTERGFWMDLLSLKVSHPDFPLELIKGAYWEGYVLTPERVYLATPINASKGELVFIEGLWYGKKFYPIRVHRYGFLNSPRNGFPFLARGVALAVGRYIILWNGSEELRVLRLRGVKVSPGQRIQVLGIAKIRDHVYLYPSEASDVITLGYPKPKPLQNSSIGDVAEAECLVLESGKTLKLNCTNLKLYGFKAKAGDTLHILALRRKSSLLCLNCSVIQPRERLPNGICEHSPGSFARISGTVAWVREYRNGFGIANVTDGSCWVLLKLPSSLEVSLVSGENVTAYGFFTTYRGNPAFEVNSGDDVCSGNSCWGSFLGLSRG